MRARHWLALVAVGFGVAGLVGTGCGGSTNEGNADAGGDVTSDRGMDSTPPPLDTGVDTGRDTGADAGNDAITDSPVDACPIDADITMLNPPDAALPGDASVGLCLGCTQTSCHMELANCNADCACKSALVTLVECVAADGGGGNPMGCLMGILGEPNARNLAFCIFGSCADQCGLNAFFMDAAPDSAPPPDAPSEAATDATTD